MDFKDQIKSLADRVEKLFPNILTEEATKNALIMPFIQILGYDVFNPLEVNPEFIADIGIKKGEKVDYAIMKDGQPAILIECKHHNEKLDPHSSQLFRYFHTTKAKFGLLTNGVIYRFYTDLVEANKMDEKPFLEFNLFDIKENLVEELKKFHKSYFDVEQITSTASELKYSNEIRTILTNEFGNPSETFVKFFTNQVYNGRTTEKVISQFTGIVKKTIQQYINDIIHDRLKAAIVQEEEKSKESEPVAMPVQEEKKIETTEMEKESYFVVKSILMNNKVQGERIAYRDAQTYFSVLLDDNNRKPVCRLYLNGERKFIGVFDDAKKETKHELAKTDDIFRFTENIVRTCTGYDLQKPSLNEQPQSN